MRHSFKTQNTKCKQSKFLNSGTPVTSFDRATPSPALGNDQRIKEYYTLFYIRESQTMLDVNGRSSISQMESGTKHQGGDANLLFDHFFSENRMKMKEIGPGETRP